MKAIAELVNNKDYKLFELNPEDDRVILMPGGGLHTRCGGGKTVCVTDKVYYPSIGGVMFLGSVRDSYAFVNDPRWVAANIVAVMRQMNETDSRPSKGNAKRAPIELRPVLDIDEATRIIQREVDGYRWLEKYQAWGVEGYEFSPQFWKPLTWPSRKTCR